MAKTRKTVKGCLNTLCEIASFQEMSMCKDWNKFTEEEQDLFYAILAGIQNDLGELQDLFDKRDYKGMNYKG
jgi:hypothetical protein